MNAVSHEIATKLDAEGVGVLGATTGWRIQANREPTEPDDVLTVYDTGGSAPALFDEELRTPSIQIRTRSHDYDAAYGKQQEAFGVLNAIVNETIEGFRYLGVWMTSDIIAIGRDENDRFLLTSNYQVERHET